MKELLEFVKKIYRSSACMDVVLVTNVYFLQYRKNKYITCNIIIEVHQDNASKIVIINKLRFHLQDDQIMKIFVSNIHKSNNFEVNSMCIMHIILVSNLYLFCILIYSSFF